MPARIARQCVVCRHVRRTELELELAGGASQAAVARKYGVSKDSAHRHWTRHIDDARKARLLVGPVQQAALAARISEENSSVIDNLRVVRAGLFESYDLALQAGDRNSTALLASKLHENLRITAGITGELASSPLIRQTTINNNLYTSPEYVRLRAGLLQLGRDHPQIRPDLIAMLKRLDSEPDGPAPPGLLLEHEETTHA